LDENELWNLSKLRKVKFVKAEKSGIWRNAAGTFYPTRNTSLLCT